MRQRTICTFDCPDTCGLLVETRPDGSVSLQGDPDHPVTAGFTCAKIKGLPARLASPERITRPLLRDGAGFRPVSWDEALDLCAGRIDALRSEPAAILHLAYSAVRGAMRNGLDLFFARLGTSRTTGSLCDEAGIAASGLDFGALDMNDYPDLAMAGNVVNWGKDLSRSSVHVAAQVRTARKRGARVLTITPGGDGNAPFTDQFIRIRPGTDRFLAAAVIRLLVESGRIDREAAARVENFGTFRSLVLGRSLDSLLECCGATRADAETLAGVYGGAAPVATVLGWALQRYLHGGENVRFINGLAILSGHVGRPGAGAWYNISSSRSLNRSWAKGLGEQRERREVRLPFLGRDILAARDPAIRMIWINGANPVNQAPDSLSTAKALEAAEFVVACEAFMTDTAARASLILPVTLMLEAENVMGSFLHNFIGYARPCRPAPGEARSDYDIVRDLGRRLRDPIDLPASEDILRMSLDSPWLDTSLEDLKTRGFVRAKRPAVAFQGDDGRPRSAYPDGMFRLATTLSDESAPPRDYPLRLLTLVRREAIHSQFLTGAPASTPAPTVRVAPDSPALAGLDLERDLYLASPLGRMRVRLETEPGLHPEALVYRRGDWLMHGGGANRLVAPMSTDLGGGTAYYSQFVRLEN